MNEIKVPMLAELIEDLNVVQLLKDLTGTILENEGQIKVATEAVAALQATALAHGEELEAAEAAQETLAQRVALLETQRQVTVLETMMPQEAPTTVYHVHTYARQQPVVKVKVERNSKGYNWEVSAEGETIDAVLALVRETDARLRAEYGGAPESSGQLAQRTERLERMGREQL